MVLIYYYLVQIQHLHKTSRENNNQTIRDLGIGTYVKYKNTIKPAFTHLTN